MNAIIVDDEQENIDLLIWELQNYSSLKITHTFTNSVEAQEHLRNNNTDVLFLDIEMPYLTGFELLAGLPNISFNLVFVTAYNQYAIEAFKHNAINYLLKPVLQDDLKKTIERLENKSDNQDATLENRIETLLLQNKIENKIAIHHKNAILLIPESDIIYCESDGNYTNVYYTRKDEIKNCLSSRNLGHFEEVLNSTKFIKPHRSYLINQSQVYEIFIKDSKTYLRLNDETVVPVSRSQKAFITEKYK